VHFNYFCPTIDYFHVKTLNPDPLSQGIQKFFEGGYLKFFYRRQNLGDILGFFLKKPMQIEGVSVKSVFGYPKYPLDTPLIPAIIFSMARVTRETGPRARRRHEFHMKSSRHFHTKSKSSSRLLKSALRILIPCES